MVILTETVYWHLTPIPALESAVSGLTLNELSIYQAFRFEQRKKAWLIGRYAAKTLLSRVLPDSPEIAAIEIENDELGAPLGILKGKPVAGCLSISHSDDFGAAAYAPLGMRIGIDIERVAVRSSAFIQDYFTEHEVRLVDADERDAAHRATLIWSAKESALKALGVGLRLDTRSVAVRAVDDSDGLLNPTWNRMTMGSNQFNAYPCAYWRDLGEHVVTMVILGASCQKIMLTEV